MHCWAHLQSVHGFRCYNNIHVCTLIALYTANACSTEREMSASACRPTRSMAGCSIDRMLLYLPLFLVGSVHNTRVHGSKTRL